VSYQLSPGTSVVFGYRLIDFGGNLPGAGQANASAQFTVRF
jgi:hypothetical protein